MFRLSDQDRLTLASAAGAASERGELLAAVRSLYEQFEAERALRQPRCDASGACCRFEDYGHRLFVSTVELAAFAASPIASQQPDWDGTGCPYQVEGLCAAREGRPFGCRVYFCDSSSKAWQEAQYERFHAAIRELHGRFGVPYLYAEWRDALTAVGLPSERTGQPGSEARSGAESEPVGNRRVVLTVVPDGR